MQRGLLVKGLRVGDKVKVITGSDKGKISTITRILRTENKVVVKDVAMIKKHVKAQNAQVAGSIQIIERPINRSNVAILDPETGKVTKCVYKTMEINGKIKRVRVSKISGVRLDQS